MGGFKMVAKDLDAGPLRCLYLAAVAATTTAPGTRARAERIAKTW